MFDVRLIGQTEKLPSVTRQRFHVAALTFGVNRVEGERTFPAAADARDDDEFVARYLDADVLEVVDARAANSDRIQDVTPRKNF